MANEGTLTYIDAYCERMGQPDFFAEPLNFFTNLFFVIAAIIIFKRLHKNREVIYANWDIMFLSFTLLVIGLGSAAFHSIPNKITLIMDVLPIGIFIYLYIVMFFFKMIRVNIFFSIMILGLFLYSGYFFQNNFSPETLNGTIMYVPTYLMLIIMSLILGIVKSNPLYSHLILTTIIWTFSLLFRTIDISVCEQTGHIGTHFLWHILNAVVLYRMLELLILDRINNKNVT